MSIHAGWYSKNQARNYPLDPRVSCLSDTGEEIPESLLADLRARWAGNTDTKLFIRSIVVGEHISISFAVKDGVDIQTVGVFSAKRSTINPHTPYLITSLARDFQGYLVLGELQYVKPITLLFSSPEQSELNLAAAYPQQFQKDNKRFGIFNRVNMELYPLYAQGLTDVEIVEKRISLNGTDFVNAIVFRLADSNNADNGAGRNILAEYAGTCGQRPETRTCTDPQPIETLNGIKPDCCGRVFIEFRGCGDMYPLTDKCGVVLVCDFTAEAACPPSQSMPDDQGRLPNEYPDDCNTQVTPSSGQQVPAKKHWWMLL